MSGRYTCNCICHVEPGIIHFTACCQGECPACLEPSCNLKQHYKICPQIDLWKSKQKREVLKQMGFLPAET